MLKVKKGIYPYSSDLMEAFKLHSISIRSKYVSTSKIDEKNYEVKLGDYLSHDAWAQENKLVCPEDYSPHWEQVINQYDFQQEALPEEACDCTRHSLHAAYLGSVTPLHYDWDYSYITHLCLYGKRRIWLRSPSPEQTLPIRGNSVLADFENMSVSLRNKALQFFGAESIELQAGEFVQFPSIWWHAVEYVETSAAISFRKEINPLLRPLTVLQRTPYLQYLGCALQDASEETIIDIVSDLIRFVIDSECTAKASSTVFSEVIHRTQKKLNIEPLRPSPWIEAESFCSGELGHSNIRTNFDAQTPSPNVVILCKKWLFMNWLSLGVLSEDDMVKFATLMTQNHRSLSVLN